MRRLALLCVLISVAVVCRAQKQGKAKHASATKEETPTDPFKGKPFKPGDIITQQLRIPIGEIVITGTIKLEIVPGDDDYFNYFHKYRMSVIKVTIDKNDRLPNGVISEIKSGSDRIDLTAKEIKGKVFPYQHEGLWIYVHDFNMDGKPDLAFVDDQGFHSNYLLYSVWVNINGKLVYWHNISDKESTTVDAKKRILSITTTDKGVFSRKEYRIEKDTVLIPLAAAQ